MSSITPLVEPTPEHQTWQTLNQTLPSATPRLYPCPTTISAVSGRAPKAEHQPATAQKFTMHHILCDGQTGDFYSIINKGKDFAAPPQGEASHQTRVHAQDPAGPELFGRTGRQP